MMVPIRCFSCGKPVAQYWEEYREGIENGEDSKELLDSFGLERYCCRQVLISHKDLIEDVAKLKV